MTDKATGIRSSFNACMFKVECCHRADELDAARADTARLDWIEWMVDVRVTRLFDIVHKRNYWLTNRCDEDDDGPRAGTLREAIDAAMQLWPKTGALKKARSEA